MEPVDPGVHRRTTEATRRDVLDELSLHTLLRHAPLRPVLEEEGREVHDPDHLLPVHVEALDDRRDENSLSVAVIVLVAVTRLVRIRIPTGLNPLLERAHLVAWCRQHELGAEVEAAL